MRHVDEPNQNLGNVGIAVIALGVGIAGLVYGRTFLLPLAIAIFIWSVIEAIVQGISSISVGGHHPPRAVALVLGFLSVGLAFYLIGEILIGQVDAIAATWPHYVNRLQEIATNLTRWLGPEWAGKLREGIASLELTGWIPGLLASTQSIFVNVFLVLAYLGFLLVERNFLSAKIAAIFPDGKRRRVQRSSSTGLHPASSATFGSRHW